jgi:4-diphosphocytidyl-2-C-methyl-D-erythritol kinase
MIVFPRCKINLGLSIIAKRADGYHELETVFYPVGLEDILEIIPTNDVLNDVHFSSSGLEVPGDQTQNLCVKAYHLLKKDFPTLPAVKMHLHKNIPMGAGLGGGSADGAFALKQLNQQFDLKIPQSELLEMALQLGSDCPFFILLVSFALSESKLQPLISCLGCPWMIVFVCMVFYTRTW